MYSKRKANRKEKKRKQKKGRKFEGKRMGPDIRRGTKKTMLVKEMRINFFF